MKKTLLTMLAAAAMVASSYGQGTVIVAYSTGPNTVKINGVAAAAASNARVELLWAPQGTTDLGLFTSLGAVINVGTPVAGFFSGGTRTIAGIAPGGVVAAYVRGFTTGSGASYDVATVRGATPIFLLDTANPSASPSEPAVNLNAVFPGLNLVAVPEPTSMTLAGLGAAALLAFRRRK